MKISVEFEIYIRVIPTSTGKLAQLYGKNGKFEDSPFLLFSETLEPDDSENEWFEEMVKILKE